MGYALFTARKLSLQSRVNSLNAQLMAISNQQNALTDQSTALQMASDLRSANAQSKAYSIFQDGIKAGGDETTLQAALQNTLASNTKATTLSNIDIQKLSAKEKALDTTRQSLETQLQAAQAELEQVKKTEQSAIKSATPQYVG